MSTTVLGIAIVVIALIAVLWYFAAYNDFVRLRNLITESWNQVDVELQRRHELVPNLVATVERAAAFERGTLEAVTNARNHARSLATIPHRAGTEITGVATAENALTAALSQLSALAEQYPALRTVQNYAALQQELSDIEDRIAASRRLYNANVRALNTKIQSIPAAIVATLHHVSPEQYFEISSPEARSAVSVDQLFRAHPDR
ncbi:LemA family protein [Nocardia yamanashiensis]|uniref:LemA family protein n=1 Tax=Nocardia yamanashiensis TaxID=209247 RepID=UPI001E51951F|nr:LemA family protein [Nocardia yamanashiensis]UGT42673.1 LemA family protein [Nocardia yamanashiensis]